MVSLKKRVDIESEFHKQDKQKSMEDNVLLIKDIRKLRIQVSDLEKQLKQKKSKPQSAMVRRPPLAQNFHSATNSTSSNGRAYLNDDDEIAGLRLECDNKQKVIEALRQQIQEAREEYQMVLANN